MDMTATSLDRYLNRVTCGDCLELMKELPDESVDLVLTDPPYGVRIANPQKGGDGGKRAKKRNKLGCYDDSPANLKILIDSFLPLVMTKSKCVVVCAGIKTLMYYPQPEWIVSWIYENKNLFGPYGFNNWTPLLCYGKDPFQQKRRGNAPLAVKQDVIYDNTPPQRSGHPTPKPVSFIEKMIERFSTSIDDIILDPFLGSGTTAVAAERLGRQWIGFEISPKYCAIAEARIAKERAQLKMEGL